MAALIRDGGSHLGGTPQYWLRCGRRAERPDRWGGGWESPAVPWAGRGSWGGACHPHPASEGLPGEPGLGAACAFCGWNNAGDTRPARQPAIVQGQTGKTRETAPLPLLRGLRALGVPCWGSSPSGPLSAPPGAQDRPHPCLPPGPEAEGVMQVGCRVTRDGGQEPGVWGRLPVGLHCSIVGVLSLSLSPLQERGGSADPSVPTISGTGGRGDSMDRSVPTISGTGWGALVSLCALPTAPRLSGRGGSTGSGSCPWS